MSKALISLFLIVTIIKSILSQGLDYTTTNLNNWACSVGKRQSPINLMPSNSTYTNNVSLVYENYLSLDNVVLSFKNNILEINNKNSLLTNNNDKGYVVLDYAGYYYKFNLEKIYVHTPSEHSIDGVFADLEVHYYHRKDLDYTPTTNQYKKLPDVSEFLIISILYSANGTQSDGGFIDNLRNYYYPTGITVNSFGLTLDIIPSGLIRDKRFFFYKGSETAFPCDETHMRYVVADIYSIKQESIQFYKKAYASKYVGGSFTKSISQLNGRSIYRNFYANTTEFASNSNFLSLNLMLFFIFLAFLI